jgi:hypothetical protein
VGAYWIIDYYDKISVLIFHLMKGVYIDDYRYNLDILDWEVTEAVGLIDYYYNINYVIWGYLMGEDWLTDSGHNIIVVNYGILINQVDTLVRGHVH